VSITVTAVNDGPVAVDDKIVTDQGVAVSGNVLDGTLSQGIPDSDPDGGQTLVVNGSPKTPPAHGLLDLKADGSFKFTPKSDFYGTDT